LIQRSGIDQVPRRAEDQLDHLVDFLRCGLLLGQHAQDPKPALATRLAMRLTTLLHHLDLLRDSGLVSAGGGRRRVYRLRRVALIELEHSLQQFLLV
jgi:DNA-binding transcriptional ArsR family regulator